MFLTRPPLARACPDGVSKGYDGAGALLGTCTPPPAEWGVSGVSARVGDVLRDAAESGWIAGREDGSGLRSVMGDMKREAKKSEGGCGCGCCCWTEGENEYALGLGRPQPMMFACIGIVGPAEAGA